MRNIILFASAVAFVGFTAPATAGSFGGNPSREVSYSDLNLGSTAGVATLKQRIRAAASSVCGSVPSQDVVAATHTRACVESATSNADAAVNRAIATARGA